MSTGNVMGKLITPTTTAAPGIWNLQEHQLAVQAGTWTGIIAPDTASNRNILTMKAIAVANATTTTFRDGSTNNFGVTRFGDVTQGTFSPYFPTGYWSAFLPSNTNALTAPTSSAFTMGTGDWTIECWYNSTSFASGNNYLIDLGSNGTRIQFASNQVNFNPGGPTGYPAAAGIGMSTGTWYHIAMVRSGNTVTGYINGTSVVTTAYSGTMTDTGCSIGNYGGGGGYGWVGNISNLRIVKGTAVYVANFTPSTAPLTAISGTSLLCLQDNRFKDNSTNNFTITRVGDTAVTRFSPFTPPRITTSGTYGGSGYFDGTGDYLEPASATNATNFSTGDFTVEFWYHPVAAGQQNCIDNMGSGSVALYRDASGYMNYYVGGNRISSTTILSNNTWWHVALVRSSGSSKLYINGVNQGVTYTDANNYAGGAAFPRIGLAFNGSVGVNGHLSNLRIVKAAVYAANFTPPTAPLTAIANTSLLVDFDNAGIYDSIGRSNLRTLGTAKVSTSTTKWGAASLALDGTANCCVKAIPTSDQPYTFGTGDFTIEMWFNLTTLGTTPAFYDWRPASTSTASPCVMVSYVTAGKLTYYMGTASAITGTTTVTTGTWHHLALCRASGVTRLFLNGVQEGSNYADTNNYTGTNPTFGALGYDTSLTAFTVNGYLEDIRVSRVARYTAAFTPPTAPFA